MNHYSKVYSCLLLLLLSIPVSAVSAEPSSPKVKIVVKRSSSLSITELRLQQKGEVTGTTHCVVRIHASSSRRMLKEPDDQTHLYSIRLTEPRYETQFTLPKSMHPRARERVYVRPFMSCEESLFQGRISRIRVRKALKRGKKKWLTSLRTLILESSVELTRVESERFLKPVSLIPIPNKSEEWLVVEQEGTIQRFTSSGLFPFLDISQSVSVSFEKGLLGVALSPDYEETKRFYAYYSPNGEPARTRLSRFTLGETEGTSPREDVLLEIPQPDIIHNGGCLLFGPDKMLYLSLGDGGPGFDPGNNAQNVSNLLGAILRIDVRGEHYSIPQDNPFIGVEGAKHELFAYGLRNPWRCSFDSATGLLWAGDVGQNKAEEINLVRSGGNYGWKIKEGLDCLENTECSDTGLIDPLYTYTQDKGASVTGGFVYRGSLIPSLYGAYIFADFISGRVYALQLTRRGDPLVVLIAETGTLISSFGESNEKELSLLDFVNGQILSLSPRK